MRKLVVAWILALALLCTGAVTLAETPLEDRAGNPITLPAEVNTIVSLSPSTTQLIIDLDAADKLVAVDTYSIGTKEGLPDSVLAFDMMAPDLEQIVALSPDVVLVTGMTLVDGDDAFAPAKELGICVAYIPSSNSIEGILEDNLFIGQVIGNEAGAKAINTMLVESINTLRVVTDTPTPVYFEVGHEPSLYSFGRDTFLNEMIEILGGVNIFADQTGWITASEESVVAAAPEIIFTNEDWQSDPLDPILTRPGWEDVPAVANDRVYLIDSDVSSQPNHHILYALLQMAQAFDK